MVAVLSVAVYQSAICEHFDALLRQRADHGDGRRGGSGSSGIALRRIDRDETDLCRVRCDPSLGDRIHRRSVESAGRSARDWQRRVFLSPWVLVHAPNYLAAFASHHPSPTPVPAISIRTWIKLFSIEPLAYGSTAANYTVLVIAIAICGLICWRVKPAILDHRVLRSPQWLRFLIFIYVLGPMQYGYQHGLRYFTPVAIGLAPAIFGSTALAAGRLRSRPLRAMASSHGRDRSSRGVRIFFVSPHLDGVQHAFSLLVRWLTKDSDYLAYNQRFSRDGAPGSEALQDRVPPGEPILAWIEHTVLS